MLAFVRRRALVPFLSMALLASACGAGESGVTALDSRSNGGGLFPTPESTVPGQDVPVERTYEVIDGVVDFGDAKTPRDYDGFLTAVFGDIQEFWAAAYPEAYGGAFEPLSGGIYAAYPSRTAPIPGCNREGTPATYEDVLNSGAYYCILGDNMAYDDENLLPSLVAELGKEAVGVVLAHEFGHAVQARSGNWNQPVILKEQQADCFAGAWTAHVATGGSSLVTFDDADVRAGIIAMIKVRDPIEGDGLADPNAHGTGFDRVGAFQDGFVGGVTRCATFFDENRLDNLIDIPFDAADPNAGNLPLIDPNPDPETGPGDIVTLIPAGLDFFWVNLTAANGVAFTAPTFAPFPNAGPYPACASVDQSAFPNNVVYCPDDNVIYWDQDVMAALAADPFTGDMSVGYLFSNAYSEAVQRAIGSQRTGEQRALTNDCLTGAWVASIVPPATQDSPVFLSAGDLDEAIVTALGRSDERTDTNVLGSAFEKIDAFRDGVLGGLPVCQQG
ncbi:MAG TPA: hypothetical protein DCR14_10135 [Acidimicrobiaceae bacterium]|nr:hypothetical protein [Acidimicrobiaceae bacterium]